MVQNSYIPAVGAEVMTTPPSGTAAAAAAAPAPATAVSPSHYTSLAAAVGSFAPLASGVDPFYSSPAAVTSYARKSQVCFHAQTW